MHHLIMVIIIFLMKVSFYNHNQAPRTFYLEGQILNIVYYLQYDKYLDKTSLVVNKLALCLYEYGCCGLLHISILLLC